MKVNLPQSAIDLLKSIIEKNKDKPSTIRIYFAGFGCSGSIFNLALDEKKESDVEYFVDDLHFIMDRLEYEKFKDVTIMETPNGFIIYVDNMPKVEGCHGCSGCN
ncbi:Fe-S cluster assembly protein HesB [Romboutsia sp. 1001713B170131_170501_G6]|uniref:Fe-S cluster assembly protein HesB n=1 Tax=Romboutsia sp. 1001713B170131_170501_G6 TaxID=2787108 RepID=UPI0018AC1013|nr:Fe-S cluster assembly protein HesB [Romboutsia sp. 1001713B170131_170501_G6]